jgi:hypothetical protein
MANVLSEKPRLKMADLGPVYLYIGRDKALTGLERVLKVRRAVETAVDEPAGLGEIVLQSRLLDP